ncbi:hypothetical protein L1987_09447 [Smallanthus sonchifolius]|uniref:Uncharacterized protein n=1 Tax=Smallanthus sonchifolius TaxID=185202 RepID=A0ACB9JNF7_9ASTR|nr:hypothetical protein L1987_09447 [Smallanthus sonchifolius]
MYFVSPEETIWNQKGSTKYCPRSNKDWIIQFEFEFRQFLSWKDMKEDRKKMIARRIFKRAKEFRVRPKIKFSNSFGRFSRHGKAKKGNEFLGQKMKQGTKSISESDREEVYGDSRSVSQMEPNSDDYKVLPSILLPFLLAIVFFRSSFRRGLPLPELRESKLKLDNPILVASRTICVYRYGYTCVSSICGELAKKLQERYDAEVREKEEQKRDRLENEHKQAKSLNDYLDRFNTYDYTENQLIDWSFAIKSRPNTKKKKDPKSLATLRKWRQMIYDVELNTNWASLDRMGEERPEREIRALKNSRSAFSDRVNADRQEVASASKQGLKIIEWGLPKEDLYVLSTLPLQRSQNDIEAQGFVKQAQLKSMGLN